MPNFLVIEGTILPENSVSSACSLEKKSWSPLLSRSEEFYDLQEIKAADQELTKVRDNTVFWKARLVSTMMTSEHIDSISFLPSDPNNSTILYVQKGGRETATKGFVAPYLSEEEAEAWGAQRFFDNQSQLEFVEELDEEIRVILSYFLRDDSTTALTLTYHEEGQEPGVYITRSWIKS